MIRTLVLTVFVCLWFIGASAEQVQNTCVPGATPTAEQQVRRRDGVRVARLVNTAEANQPGARAKKFLRQEELSSSPYVQKHIEAQDGFVKSLNFKTGEEVLPGWELKLDVTDQGYWFIVRDKTDPCGFSFVSNQNGLIYRAEPLQ